MNTSNRNNLLTNLSRIAIFAIAVSATAGQAWADKPKPTAATLTLLSEINKVLAGTEDSEGLSQETLVQLAESVLWTNEPYIDLASSEPALLSSYAGAKLTNNNGEIAYIAINTSAVETVVSFPDTYSMNVPADGFAIRLQNFGHNYYILDFGGKIIVDGRDFLIATTGAAIELPYVGDGRSYIFTDSGMSLDSGAITVNGAIEVFGTDGDDDFDFSGLETNLDFGIFLDGREGLDTLRSSNFDSTIYLDADSDTYSKENHGFHINNFEQIIGGEGANTLVGSNIDTTWTVSSPNSGTINSGSEISFQNFGNFQGGNNTDTFVFLDGGTVNGTLEGRGGDDEFFLAGEVNLDLVTSTLNAAILSSPNFEGELQATAQIIQGSVSLTENGATIANIDAEVTLNDTTPQNKQQSNESGGGSFGLLSLFILCLLPVWRSRKALKLNVCEISR